MKPIFKSSLIKDVVISYVCMIVFPVMIILGLVFLAAGRYIYRAATESVTVTQQAVLELYREETRSSALALSRVVNMNGGTTIRDAAGHDAQKQEQALEQLDTMYQMLAAPEYKILDIHIYRRDGSAIIPKGEMRYSVDELRQKGWYQAAVSNPGLVHTALVDEDYFYRIRSAREILEISAYAPGEDTQAECIVLYRISKIPDSIKNYNKNGKLGTICLINSQGNIVAAPGQKNRIPSAVMEKIRQNAADPAGSARPAASSHPAKNNHVSDGGRQQISYRGIRYMILPMPEPGYYLVSAVNETSLFGQFTLFSLISMAVILCVVLMFIFYFKWYMNRLLIPLGHLTEGMREVEHRNLDTQVEMCRQQDIARMIATFNNMVEQIKKLIHDKEQIEKEKYQEELHTLQSQMNPHFLYNSLNIINWVCLKGEQENASKMLLDLSRMLQYTSQNGDVLVPLWEDLDWLKRYIGIMQKRYQDQFEVSMDIPEYLRSLEVPKLFLQPFVENAIVHGFKNYQDSGKIWISAEEEENDILFYVEDNGCGICEEDLKEVLNKERKSIGVRNTNKRIRMIYGEKYGVTISSQLEEGTVVTIRLPLKVNSKKQS